MRISRFFVDLPLTVGVQVVLPEAVAHHAQRVLRLRAPATMILFNGIGGEYMSRLVDPLHDPVKTDTRSRQRVPTPLVAEVLSYVPRTVELPIALTLVQALPQGEQKFDWIIEKAVECGVNSIQPVVSAFSGAMTKMTAERLDKKQRHWQALAIAASEQCGRTHIVKIAAPCLLRTYLQTLAPDTLHLAFDPQAETSLASLGTIKNAKCSLYLGAEGGWHEDELNDFTESGIRLLRLGDRILRCETAGIVAISALSASQGWLG